MVLGTNVWPLHPPTTDYSVPREILPAYERFLKFYNTAHSCVSWLLRAPSADHFQRSKAQLAVARLQERAPDKLPIAKVYFHDELIPDGYPRSIQR
jgi:hypothetical protein